MSIKYYANRVQETSTSIGSGNLVLSGAPLGYRTFVAGIGANNTFNYYIYRQDTNFEWEIGVGYILSSGGINQLVRQRVISSSNGNNLVGFTSGTKYVETIISEDRTNTSFTNIEQKSSSFSPAYIPATYIIDASSSNVQITLPAVSAQSDPIVLGFMLNKTSGNIYEQINAIQLIPNGIETIGGTASADVSILNDYLQIVSVPSQSGWLLLDPIQDATNPYGSEGTVQFKSGSAFSGVNQFTWDSSNKLLIGNSGVGTADIILPSSSGQTTIFNQNLRDNDLRVAGSGNSHLLFVDGGLNRVGINTSSVPDTLSINASSGSGLTISRSGVGPRILLSNTSVSGVTSNNVLGSIVIVGLNTSGSIVEYGAIKSIIENNSDGSESASLVLEGPNNGAIEQIAVFSPSGVTLGYNSQNFDGIVLGSASSNEGNNVVAGYFNNVCGENCVVLGDNSVLSSGTFGGSIGSNHAVSGTNIWILGGSGVTASGDNRTILALDDKNYFEIQKSGNVKYVTLTDKDSTFSIDNISILTSGVDQNLAFTFLNSSGIQKTGLILTSSLDNVVNNNEISSFTIKILSSGSPSTVLALDNSNVVVGDNSVSGNNMVFGFDNLVSNPNNVVMGKDISVTGSNNVLVGNNIDLGASATGITIVGRDNQCLSSGNLGIVIVGNTNTANEDYSVAIGVSNVSSGLYTTSCGYLNGVHGDYSVGIGDSNLVVSNYSVAIGRNNNLTTTDLAGSVFAMGIGNVSSISNTGITVGYLNSIYGSGGTILGASSSASGSNNYLVGNSLSSTGLNNILVGSNSSLSGTNSLIVGRNSSLSGTNNAIFGNSSSISGTNNFVLGNNNFLIGSGNTIIGNNRSVNGTGIIDIFASPTNGISCTPTGIYIYTDTGWTFDTDITVTGNGTFVSGIICSGTGYFGSNVTVLGNLNSSGISILTSGVSTLGDVIASGTGVFNSGVSTLRNVIASGTGVFNSGISTLGNISCSGTGVFNNSTINTLTLPSLATPTGQPFVSSLVLQSNQVFSITMAVSGVPASPVQLTASSADYQFLYPTGTTDLYLPNGTGLYLGKQFLIANMSTSPAINVYRSGSTSLITTIYAGYNSHFLHAGDNNWVRINNPAGYSYGLSQN
jgi:hypothetical protein